jgi:serine/threonine-protein kinase
MVDPVPSIRRLRPTVPAALEAVLLKALARDAVDRFPSVVAFAEALATPVTVSPTAKAVAVLPFISVGADPENEIFADGITEDVIAHLAKIRALNVISRGSVMPFKQRTEGLRAIASRLQASTLLDGSVRRAGDRVRIVAQLVDPETGRDLWSETYDRQLTDIFAIQTDVALRIAETLATTLSSEERSRIRKEPTRDMVAYRYYLQGRHWLLKFTDEAMRDGIGYFERAIEQDPDFAMAHAAVAYAYLELGETGAEAPDVAYPIAERMARRALTLDEELASAHCTLGYLRMLREFDWAGAEAGLRRALELSPSDADTHDLYGRLCGAMRRFDEAVSHSTQAQNLDPLAHRTDLATQFLRAGRPQEALEVAVRAVEFEASYPRAHAVLGWSLIGVGRVAEGLAELERAVELSGRSSQWMAQLGQAHALHGDRERARALLAELVERARHEFVSTYHLAYLYTGLGEHDQALDLLMEAIERRTGSAYGIHGSFLFAPLRDHPRYPELVRKLKLA